MSLKMGQATVVSEVDRIRMVGSALRKTGRPVAFVPLTTGVHAGHIALVRAARRIRGAVTVVALQEPRGEDVDLLRAEGVDVIWDYTPEKLWPHGRRITISPRDAADFPAGLEPDLSGELTLYLTLMMALSPTDVLIGEKDYELLLAIHHAVQDLHLGVRVQGVPAVRMPDGVVMSLRNTRVPEDKREDVAALSAALTAGAHAAEAGAEKVREVAAGVLEAAGVEPEYLELRGRDLGEPPAEGDARLLVAATIGGVRVIDNVGLPLGIGFTNIEEHEAKAELEREKQREQNQSPED
ncbi:MULTISPECIES: pantoate--beta-alanine ligase [Corynebacterium]|uniref:pantoate--beta-alanine ligase n=1 Tax=Corynebacterium TaxID=1716 RepID=UPI00254F77D6|nr:MULTISPECIES: pantoate--beta-alanine ligase [unclassified Corynebacterium]MDK8452727.1 pantoate--beta-alanine ligase [Corynebacterium sp. MSK084]MDK8467149.1 pantoate--beta-alanine ligase [Corynebacterium sp. MSK130]MDK8491621.1 pantoate--beta-alanine ligase [Corynebacterium sp. MSK175]MDK8514586.1 pantoate--beta-alanine ligase [Corynebacterium sp. MSK123]MDK8547818.1 pantoate--beta-alanine ligase [Corynebacterium sp. MSK222]